MAKFCHSNLVDAESVSLVTNLLSKNIRIMPKLEYQDQWPIIDSSNKVYKITSETKTGTEDF